MEIKFYNIDSKIKIKYYKIDNKIIKKAILHFIKIIVFIFYFIL